MGITQQIGASSLIKPGVCTSTTKPASPYEGQVIYETDTGLTSVWNGTAWRLMSASNAGSGATLQTVFNSPVFASTVITSATETMCTSVLAQITPKSATSKIGIQFTFGGYPTAFNSYYSLFIRRGATGPANKITSNNGTWGDWTQSFTQYTGFGSNAHQQYSIHAYDTAGTTNTITYSLTAINHLATGSFVLWDANNNRITLTEVAA